MSCQRSTVKEPEFSKIKKLRAAQHDVQYTSFLKNSERSQRFLTLCSVFYDPFAPFKVIIYYLKKETKADFTQRKMKWFNMHVCIARQILVSTQH